MQAYTFLSVSLPMIFLLRHNYRSDKSLYCTVLLLLLYCTVQPDGGWGVIENRIHDQRIKFLFDKLNRVRVCVTLGIVGQKGES